MTTIRPAHRIPFRANRAAPPACGTMRASLMGGALALALLLGPCVARADDPAASGIAVAVDAGAAVTLTPAELAQLPAVTAGAAFATEHGPRQASFEGPLLWSVLDHAHATPAKAGEQVRRLVLLTGSDGYTALLALGEVSPAFEGKQVLVALRMDGKPLDHPRIVVPGDKHGGRSVHDVVRIAVSGVSAAPAHGLRS